MIQTNKTLNYKIRQNNRKWSHIIFYYHSFYFYHQLCSLLLRYPNLTNETTIWLQIPFTGDECCGSKKKCELKPMDECPTLSVPGESCGHGKKYQLIQSGLCLEYACVCVPSEECPHLTLPDDGLLKHGEYPVPACRLKSVLT